MPLIYVNSPEGTFSDSTRDALAEELTVAALESEGLPTTPFVKSTTWIYFRDHPASHVYHGGKPGGTNAGIAEKDLAPVYIVLRDVSTIDWGVFGDTITLNDLRNPPADAKPV